jgi:hypothetical protein
VRQSFGLKLRYAELKVVTLALLFTYFPYLTIQTSA